MLLPPSQVRLPISIDPVAAAISAKSAGATKSASGRPAPQSIRWPGAAMNPSSDIALFTTTLPFPVLDWFMGSHSRIAGARTCAACERGEELAGADAAHHHAGARGRAAC